MSDGRNFISSCTGTAGTGQRRAGQSWATVTRFGNWNSKLIFSISENDPQLLLNCSNSINKAPLLGVQLHPPVNGKWDPRASANISLLASCV